ncbi:MAG: hypothetical protein ACKPJT_16950, partial [Microcystis panniformis]
SLGFMVGFPYVNPTYFSFVGWVERINMLKKTSQFSGKAKPNRQHLNLTEYFCWVSLGLWLCFLTSRIVGWFELIIMLKKTSKFPGKAKHNT